MALAFVRTLVFVKDNGMLLNASDRNQRRIRRGYDAGGSSFAYYGGDYGGSGDGGSGGDGGGGDGGGGS